MVQRKELNFEGQNIYIGIDVHLKTWHVSILTESGCLKKHSQQSSAQALSLIHISEPTRSLNI